MKTKRKFTLQVFEVKDKDQLDISILLQAIQALINNQKIVCSFTSEIVLPEQLRETRVIKKRRPR